MKEPIQKFLEAISPLRKDYATIDVRVVAFRWKEHWMNLCTRAILSPDRPRRYKFIPPSGLRDMFVDIDYLPIDELDRFLDVFDSGSLVWKDKEVVFKRPEAGGLGAPYSPSFRVSARRWSRERLGFDFHSYVLAGWEGVVPATIGNDGFEKLESMLASLKLPFKGVGDLVRTYTGNPGLEGPSSGSTFETIAPVWLRFEPESHLRGDRAVVRVLTHPGYKAGEVSVGIVQSEGPEVLHRGRTRLSVSSRQEEKVILEGEVGVDRRTEQVTLLLSYRGTSVDRLELFRNRVGRRNPRLSVVASVDPQLTSFREGITGRAKKTPGKAFEQAVVTLLTCLGFSCLYTGGDERNPDALAWAVSPSVVFVVECTIGEPDLRNKVTKFASRLRHVKAVSEIGEAVGVLATALSRETINPADLERMTTDGILLLDEAAIRELQELAERGATVGEAMELFQELASRQRLPFRDFVPS